MLTKIEYDPEIVHTGFAGKKEHKFINRRYGQHSLKEIEDTAVAVQIDNLDNKVSLEREAAHAKAETVDTLSIYLYGIKGTAIAL